ncbi:conserved protein of unknown function [Pseudodesulfovibrio profundus]|uniref:DUF2958 domain-containing protein n=1 Tax=Pseudodesulfovibrio profundus TaxID=57320 RepID=A0A2C8FCR1_9BACT|nr:DUF2958 domain-containing protein [Pseudodesulfovibrio profundus]SOB59853.1 conserved protein of unknown function [Pseudodesulfovibrio profundus]
MTIKSKGLVPRMPRLYDTEDTPADEKLIWAHFFIGDSHWYAAEFDGKDTFFGYAVLNGDMMNSEWGYFSLAELTELRVGPLVVCIEDRWLVREFREVMDERHGGGWLG